ncbi:MAG: ATP-binding protein [Bacteroidota bacterium]|nr:ATP-binding protein [Bacteroidota bacterium]
MAENTEKSRLKYNVALGFLFILVISALAISLLYKGIHNLQKLEQANSVPNNRLHRINHVLTLINQAETQSRSYFILRSQPDLGEYVVTLNLLEKDIDELVRTSKNDTSETSKLNVVRDLLRRKKEIISQLKPVEKDALYSKAIDEVYSQSRQIAKPAKVVKENVIVKRDSIVSLPKKKNFFQRLKFLFSGSSDEKQKNTQVITQQVVRMDTIVHGTSADSIAQTLRQALDRMKRREALLQDQSEDDEGKLLENDRILLQKIREIVNILETREVDQISTKLKQSSAILQKSTRAIILLAIVSIIVIAFFLFLIFKDIARDHKYRQALQQARIHAEELSKLKEQFLANMSHEIRTPLSSIIGFTEQLQKTNLAPDQQQYLRTISKSSGHLLGLVNDILDLSKIEAGKLQLEKTGFNIAELIDDVCESFSLKANDKNIKIIKDIDPRLIGPLMGDSFRIRQVITNLVSNALKFTEEGSVTISGHIPSQSETLTIVELSVSDTGIGIDPEKQHAIFEEFSQADSSTTRKYGGTGLGLAIAKRIVELHGGQMHLKSTPGEGSTFSFEIPFEVSSHNVVPTSPLPIARKENLDNLKNIKILVVDDDETSRSLITLLFKNSGLDGHTLSDPTLVMDYLLNHRVDILFSDIQMPKMSGIELIRLIRSYPDKKISALPVIALTANASNLSPITNVGFTNRLAKPFKESDFFAIIVNTLHPGIAYSTTSSIVEELDTEEVYSLEEISQFADGDKDAIRHIINSFITNSRKSIDEIKALIPNNNIVEISARAHKLLPTFRQLHVYEVVDNLEELERYKELNVPEDEFIDTAQNTCTLAEQVIELIRKEVLS